MVSKILNAQEREELSRLAMRRRRDRFGKFVNERGEAQFQMANDDGAMITDLSNPNSPREVHREHLVADADHRVYVSSDDTCKTCGLAVTSDGRHGFDTTGNIPNVGGRAFYGETPGVYRRANADGTAHFISADGEEYDVPVTDLVAAQLFPEDEYVSEESEQAIEYINERLNGLRPQDKEQIKEIFHRLQYGAWGDLRQDALSAVREIRESGEGDPWLDNEADATYDKAWEKIRYTDKIEDNAEMLAIAAAADAARAVASRHLIGYDPRWTVEAYDNLVRPWQMVVGLAHPQDLEHPVSWERRPLVKEAGEWV